MIKKKSKNKVEKSGEHPLIRLVRLRNKARDSNADIRIIQNIQNRICKIVDRVLQRDIS